MELKANQSPLKAFYFHEPFNQNFWPDILDEVYKKQVYIKFLPKTKENTICIDIGANVGLCTYYFSQYFGKVYSVEPSKQHIEALSAMVKQNKLTNVTVVPQAMSNKVGLTKFYHNDNQTMFSLEEVVNNKEDYEEVQTTTLDELFKTYKIDHVDLLKLDVEGEEGKIINSEGFKKIASKIKVIAGEYHDWASCSAENMQHGLEDLGYEFKWRRDTVAQVFEAVRI